MQKWSYNSGSLIYLNMPVIVEQSACIDCEGLTTCQRLKRLNPGRCIRDNHTKVFDGFDTGTVSGAELYVKPGRQEEVFDLIIVNCSMKKQYPMRKERGVVAEEESEHNKLYYCNICKSMHMNGSDIGKSHKEKSDEILRDRNGK